ncbi:MAG TPA: galactose-1-phosphate uridylyltransferase [Actinomycetota bacterium]|nr:galactose-1-phosphate uridylyltransferase [Actinomycetota bacterium]
MSNLRQDPTTKEWVIIAPRRAQRPHARPEGGPRPLPSRDPGCPFCPGNEAQTPPEILRVGDERGWRIRVVPNLFPAVDPAASPTRDGDGVFGRMEGLGAHEVIIESPRHDARFDEMSDGEVEEVVGVWRERYAALERQPWARSVVLFKNFGPAAGTSLVHIHSQVIAIPVYAPEDLRRHEVAVRYFDDTGRSVYDDLREAERRAGERVVAEAGSMLAVAPFASRGPFETWILPSRHRSSFARADDAELADLARVLREVLRALREAAGDPDFNVVVASGSVGDRDQAHFTWHVRILPRLATAAGFEMGSGMSINPVAPEDAATQLRDSLQRARQHAG